MFLRKKSICYRRNIAFMLVFSHKIGEQPTSFIILKNGVNPLLNRLVLLQMLPFFRKTKHEYKFLKWCYKLIFIG